MVRRSIAWFFLLASSAALPLFAADITDIEVEVTMERTSLASGERVTTTVTQCNPTDEVIDQRYNCPCCHDFYYLLDEQGEVFDECGRGCITAVVSMIWQPGECKVREIDWDIQGLECFEGPVPDGIYTFQHALSFPGYRLETEGPTFVIGSEPISVPSLSPLGLISMTGALALAALFLMVKRRG
ncbi:MAG: hypothetical protein AAF725_23455 [Acidobacteriota bacterium]